MKAGAAVFNEASGHWEKLGEEWILSKDSYFQGQKGVSAGKEIVFYKENEDFFVAYQNGMYEDKLSIRKFNGVSWEILGQTTISDGIANSIYLYSYQGNTFVSYRDNFTGKVNIKKYVENNWLGSEIPIANYSAGINGEGENLYILFTETIGGKLSVVKLSGYIPTFVGKQNFSSRSADWNLMIDVYNGVPYVLYYGYNSSIFYVAKFD
ncbi:MAG TPA: hypothetical protein DHW82_05840 [Spirochaetia bacterium]|nr:hypothetical protein [Spirochaetia bacterium]